MRQGFGGDNQSDADYGRLHDETVDMAAVDGKVILTATDDSIKKAGKVGLWTKADAQTYFDRFTVEEETNDDGDDDNDEVVAEDK